MAAVARIGCVSYLNAKPLIDGMAAPSGDSGGVEGADVDVRFDVPSGLLDDLASGAVDVALCPVIDYFRSPVPLMIVPVGGIGCDGPTLTVRLYSTLPLDQVTQVHADTDSHTSVALLRVLMQRMYARPIEIIDFNTREADPLQHVCPPAMLLIGDKVVTDSPAAVRYPYQMDLGEAWKEVTGLPFVFAVWMARQGAALGHVPQQLDACRRRNAGRIAHIVTRYAPAHGWPADLAHHYLADLLQFGIGPRQLDAIRRFGDEAADAGVIPATRPITLAPGPLQPATPSG